MIGPSYSFGYGWSLHRAPARPIRQLAQIVADKHGLPLTELTGPNLNRQVCAARFEAMWLCRQERRSDGSQAWTLPRIGKFFNRDHTTVLYALKRYEARNLMGIAA